MQITQVIRGEDHIGNTPKQILIYEALGAAVPEFGHTPLILNQAGAKLSKRDGVTSISDFQQMGYLPEAIGNYMTLLGWSPPEGMTEIFSLAEAADKFSFDRVNKAGAKFDWDKLNWLNSQYLHAMPVAELTDLLIPRLQAAEFEFDWAGDRAWLEQLTALLAPSLVRLDEAAPMSQYLFTETVEFTEKAKAQLKQEGAAKTVELILAAIPTGEHLTETTAQELLDRLTQEHSLKKVKPTLRAALTGSMQGPDLLPVLAAAESARLGSAAAAGGVGGGGSRGVGEWGSGDREAAGLGGWGDDRGISLTQVDRISAEIC